MDTLAAIEAFSALAHEGRLTVLRLLVRKEPDGISAGKIAELVGVPQNTMSTHLAVLARAGLVEGLRQSRSIIYRANLTRIGELASFLLKDCCEGKPEICAPVLNNISSCENGASCK